MSWLILGVAFVGVVTFHLFLYVTRRGRQPDPNGRVRVFASRGWTWTNAAAQWSPVIVLPFLLAVGVPFVESLYWALATFTGGLALWILVALVYGGLKWRS